MADTITTPAGATPDRPWLGLAHFTAADRDYFYGREEEIRHLADRVRRTPLVILYGVSGYGKSSLLGAGLIPTLEEVGFAVTMMRRCYEALAERPLVDDVIAEILARHPGAKLRPADRPPTLWEFFHDLTQPWFQEPGSDSEATARPVLVLDQFEEIFTRGEDRETHDKEADARARAHAQDFLEQLSDLIENRPPAALRAMLESGAAEERRAILSQFHFDARPVRCVLALRDDFLAHLERWRRAMPSIMEHRVELQLLSGPQAVEAVFKPGTKRPDQPPIIPRKAAEAIVRRVAQLAPDTPLQEIQAVPSLLSLLCEQLNSTRLAEENPLPEISIADVELRSTHILQQFYLECFASIPVSDREKVRAFVEDGMISETGHRHPVAREAAEHQLRKAGVLDPSGVFDELIGRRLLSAEEQRGSSLLEITHDVLIPLILESRNERQERWRKEEQERELAAEREKLAAAALQSRRRLYIAIGMAALTLLAVASAIFGFLARREAVLQRDESRYHEGLAWMFRAHVAKERGAEYPGMLLYAATAIGFEGSGRTDEAEVPHRYITSQRDRRRHEEATKWLKGLPSYLPVWSSPLAPVPLEALAVSPSGRHVAAGGQDGKVMLWDFSSAGPATVISTDAPAIADLSFAPDGTCLMVATGKETHCWNFETRTFSAQPLAAATAIGYGSNAESLISAQASGELSIRNDGQEIILQTGSPTPAARIAQDGVASRTVATVPDRGLLVFFPEVGKAANAWMSEGWNLPKPSNTSPPPQWLCSDASAAAISPDGTFLAVGSRNGSISIWDAATAVKLAEISPDQRHRDRILDLAFRSDGLALVSASGDGRIRIWRLAPAQPAPSLVATLTGHIGPVNRVRFLAGGELLASCGADGSAKLWNVSEQTSNHSGLYRYVREGWYRLGLDTDPPRWGGKSGFIDLPETSLPFLWQRPSPATGVMTVLQSEQEWPGVISLMPGLSEADRMTTASKVTTYLSEEADKGAAAGRWNLVRMRLSQWRKIGRPASETLERLEREVAVLASEGKNFTTGDQIDLVWCRAGTFTMGSPDTDPERRDEGEIPHQVTLSTGFWIGKREVSQGEWKTVMNSNPSEYDELGAQHPIERIDWHQAMDFCRKLTDRERARGSLPAGWEYSLPTEAQWEYACRAGGQSVYCYGDEPGELHAYGNFRDLSNAKVFPPDPQNPADLAQDDGQPVTSPVGRYQANRWGIHDMHGNVREWCRDRLVPQNQKHFKPGDVVPPDPLGDNGNGREIRGGSWKSHPRDCRSARGFAQAATSSTPDVGMRVVLTRIREAPAAGAVKAPASND
ncbi:SUMF1/EgtB/PvdO family nonheme iron enzyme [Luteolibacter arcticus]|uniref:SUMF1/EgtB/PvdO family nonheme iron enzyme n=1 Tax=Luteolibacter arcticus TaxID=1581411 RepID=A0ABT3GBZ5_9BACT|nr:SUMF1/EgtB/PvdO family nonheme iron enzyme [Luteolibacter arcticus]MCW1921149.1 SUMF1/EgtB/PvdO family nonheme iron enzyme [Luteolibacter arcticus]